MKILTWVAAIFFALVIVNSNATAQVEILAPADGAVSTLRNQAVIGQAPANLPIRIDVNGVPVDSGTVRADGVFEFLGVPTPEGPVTYRVVATMRGGKTFSSERSIHILGAPDSIILQIPDVIFPSDGISTVEITGSIADRWGIGIPEGYMVTVAADSLTVIAADADSASRGIQVALAGGALHFALKSSTHAGPASIMLEVNGITTRRTFFLTTPKQPFMLTGSVSATGSLINSSGSVGEFGNALDVTDGLHHQGRIAVTGRGTVLENYLVTLSVDSDRKLKDRLYRDLDPNVLYGIYGDNSAVTYEAQSASPVYVKVERDQSYAMYGDFNTGLTEREFAAYNRTFTGGKLHVQNGWAHADVFGTVTNRRVDQEEIRGAGNSGFYFLKNSNIVSGSEKVRIEVRDRFHNEIVVSSQDKARLSDYDIDYLQGTLYFKQPVPSLDEHRNPVYIVVSSEAITNASNNYVAGGSGEITLFDRLTLGATTVVEQRAPTNYTLLGGNGGLKLGSFGGVRAEIARSADAGRQGYAWKVEGELTPIGKALAIRPYYRRVDGAFNNTMQRGSNQEVGTTKYGVGADLQAFSDTKLHAELYHQLQATDLVHTDLQSISGSVAQTLWSGGHLTARVEDVRYRGPGVDTTQGEVDTHSTFLSGRFEAVILKGLSGNVTGEYNIRRASESVRPNSIGVGLEYEIIPAITVFATQEFLDGGGSLTSVGARSRIGDHTTLDGRYEMGNTVAGGRAAASIGLKNTLAITDELTANILYEKTKDFSHDLVGARTPNHDALSLALEYMPAFPLKVSVKGEFSGADSSRRTGLVYGVVYRLFDDIGLMAKGNYYKDAGPRAGNGSSQGTYVFGLAYRPATSNWLNLVGQVEIRWEENQVVAPIIAYRSTIVSIHAYTEPISGIELGIKYALKSALDQSDGLGIRSVTDLIQARAQYDLTSFLNLAVEGRMLRQQQIGDMRLGCSAEVGVVVLANTMLVGGYNFQGYRERDLTDYTFTAAGPYITVRAKFTEHLFGIGE